MNLHNIRGGTKEELDNKQYNIGVGISLGNKWFTPENILGLVRWSLKNTRKNVAVYVADSIHALNIEVRSEKSPDKALEIALEQGEKILNEVRALVNQSLSSDEIKKITYARWKDLSNDHYRDGVKYLYELFDSNGDFSKAILSIVKSHTSKEEKSFSDDDLKKMAYYILEELPEVLSRVRIGEDVYDAYAYPFDGELAIFVEKLQKGEVFPEVAETILKTKPKVFLEVR